MPTIGGRLPSFQKMELMVVQWASQKISCTSKGAFISSVPKCNKTQWPLRTNSSCDQRHFNLARWMNLAPSLMIFAAERKSRHTSLTNSCSNSVMMPGSTNQRRQLVWWPKEMQKHAMENTTSIPVSYISEWKLGISMTSVFICMQLGRENVPLYFSIRRRPIEK